MLLLRQFSASLTRTPNAMNNVIRQGLTKTSAFKWLVSVALAWSQLASATHQLDHQASDLGETCAICLKFDRDDDALIDAGEEPALSTIPFVEPLGAQSVVRVRVCSHYCARASP